MIMGAWGLGGKKAPTAKSYVQDGLIAMWDGIENVGFGVRDTSSAKWYDIVNPNKSGFSIVSGQSFWGETSFDFNDTFEGSGASAGLYRFNSSDFSVGGTMEICLKLHSVTDSAATIFGTCVGGGGLVFGYNSPWNQHYYFYVNPMSNYPYYNPSFVGSGEMRTFSNSTDNLESYGRMFVNGNVVKEANTTLSYSGNYACRIASNYAGASSKTNASVHNIRIYSRALTEAEIAANYAVDKERFNLP